MAKNPPWTRDELILALDLYLKSNFSRIGPEDRNVIELSRLLNELPIHPVQNRGVDFRNPNGVCMKLGNFASLDPSYKGKGLSAKSRLDVDVWIEFWGDKNRLVATARKIREHYRTLSAPRTRDDAAQQFEDDDEFAEGRILTRIHKARERNSSAVRKKKRIVETRTGKLACEVCGFDFLRTYGELGRGFAECHHTVPVSRLVAGKPTRLSDLVIVCANCHRMLHRSKTGLTIAALKSLLLPSSRE